jgi:RNA polymerase sigma-70 factor (ECF subfamily)
MQKKGNSIQSLALDFLENRDNKTFRTLINRLKPGLISYTYRYVNDMDLCKEIVSKTFIAVWEKLDQYNSQYNFSTWVYAIAKNESLGQLRIKKRNLSHEKLTENHSKVLKFYSPVTTMDIEVIGPSGEELTICLYEKTIEEIKSLEEPYRTVMIERELNNKRLQDIAADLNWNLSTVKTRLRKARKDIAKSLKDKHPNLLEAYYEEEQYY